MRKNFVITLLLSLGGLLFASVVHAENMQSPCYYLQMGTLNIASGTKTSGSFNLTDTAGQTGPGMYDSSNDVKSGFQYIYPIGHATPSAFGVPCPIAFATPTPAPTPTPGPVLPPVITIITELLEKAGLITPLIVTELARLIEETAPVVAAALPVVVTTVAVAQAAASLVPIILEIISRLLQAVGLIPVKRPRGVVFDTKTGKGIPFATITFVRVADGQIVDTVVSDVQGVYRSIKLPSGIYRLEVVHSDYIFPTKVTPRFTLNPHDFYRGEPFEITNRNQEELFLIPMDPLYEEAGLRRPLSFYFQVLAQVLRRVLFNLFYPIVALSFIITLIFPTLLNIAICILYIIMIFYRVRHTKAQPPLMGKVVDRYGKPLIDVMVRCIETQTNQVSALLITNPKGEFRVNLPTLQYTLVVVKDGYVVEQSSRDYANVFVAHTGNEGMIIIRMMTVKEAFPESQS